MNTTNTRNAAINLKSVNTKPINLNIHSNFISVPEVYDSIETEITLTINKPASGDILGLVGIACLQQYYGITEKDLVDAFPESFV